MPNIKVGWKGLLPWQDSNGQTTDYSAELMKWAADKKALEKVHVNTGTKRIMGLKDLHPKLNEEKTNLNKNDQGKKKERVAGKLKLGQQTSALKSIISNDSDTSENSESSSDEVPLSDVIDAADKKAQEKIHVNTGSKRIMGLKDIRPNIMLHEKKTLNKSDLGKKKPQVAGKLKLGQTTCALKSIISNDSGTSENSESNSDEVNSCDDTDTDKVPTVTPKQILIKDKVARQIFPEESTSTKIAPITTTKNQSASQKLCERCSKCECRKQMSEGLGASPPKKIKSAVRDVKVELIKDSGLILPSTTLHSICLRAGDNYRSLTRWLVRYFFTSEELAAMSAQGYRGKGAFPEDKKKSIISYVREKTQTKNVPEEQFTDVINRVCQNARLMLLSPTKRDVLKTKRRDAARASRERRKLKNAAKSAENNITAAVTPPALPQPTPPALSQPMPPGLSQPMPPVLPGPSDPKSRGSESTATHRYHDTLLVTDSEDDLPKNVTRVIPMDEY